MDISKYKELKEGNHISFVALGNSFAVVKKQYDPDTGLPKAQITEAIGEDQVLKLKADLEKQLEQVDQLLKDMDDLKLKEAEPIK